MYIYIYVNIYFYFYSSMYIYIDCVDGVCGDWGGLAGGGVPLGYPSCSGVRVKGLTLNPNPLTSQYIYIYIEK